MQPELPYLIEKVPCCDSETQFNHQIRTKLIEIRCRTNVELSSISQQPLNFDESDRECTYSYLTDKSQNFPKPLLIFSLFPACQWFPLPLSRCPLKKTRRPAQLFGCFRNSFRISLVKCLGLNGCFYNVR